FHELHCCQAFPNTNPPVFFIYDWFVSARRFHESVYLGSLHRILPVANRSSGRSSLAKLVRARRVPRPKLAIPLLRRKLGDTSFLFLRIIIVPPRPGEQITPPATSLHSGGRISCDRLPDCNSEYDPFPFAKGLCFSAPNVGRLVSRPPSVGWADSI